MKLALALAVLVGFVAASPTTPTGLPGLQRRQTEACATACTAPITEFQVSRLLFSRLCLHQQYRTAMLAPRAARMLSW